MIGLGHPPLPPPAVRNPLEDELHLRDGSVHPGPLVSLDARRVTTFARACERRDVRGIYLWIYLRDVPAPGAVAGGTPGRAAEDDDGTCGFWVGTLRQRVEIRRTRAESQLRRTVRTVYAARRREVPGSRAPGTTTIGSRRIQAVTVRLALDGGAVREDV